MRADTGGRGTWKPEERQKTAGAAFFLFFHYTVTSSCSAFMYAKKTIGLDIAFGRLPRRFSREQGVTRPSQAVGKAC